MFLRGILLLLLCVPHMVMSAPWMTGPILAPAGRTIPAYHVNVEPYAFYTMYPEQFRNVEFTPVFTAGLTDFMDLQTSIPYDISWERRARSSHVGDYSLGLGFQALRQQDDSWIPDLRILVQELFPTGQFNHLNPNKLRTDQTGGGAYITSIGFNFQRLKQFHNQHYLRTRLSLLGSRSSSVHVEGVNTFGGTMLTHGVINPATSFSIDMSFEYTLTQHWVPVFEMTYAHSSATHFSGNPGFTPGGAIGSLGGRGGDQGMLEPAIEYNFSANLGVIAGVWFSITGPHAGEFVANTIAINYYF